MKEKEGLTGAELVNPYDNRRHKTDQVEQMFDSIAPAYDFMNTAMTFGLHRWWRKKALNTASKKLGSLDSLKILDIATGTGDVALDLHRRFPNAEITGLDLSEGMLEIARNKLEKLDEIEKKRITFEQGDSLKMRFANECFDFITVAYGVRNFEHLEQGLSEMARVLKPGGVLCIIELSEPKGGLTRWAYRLYARHIIPAIGRFVSGDSKAYTYLPQSIAVAPQREKMTEVMLRAGFGDCRFKSLTFGSVTYYLASPAPGEKAPKIK